MKYMYLFFRYDILSIAHYKVNKIFINFTKIIIMITSMKCFLVLVHQHINNLLIYLFIHNYDICKV